MKSLYPIITSIFVFGLSVGLTSCDLVQNPPTLPPPVIEIMAATPTSATTADLHIDFASIAQPITEAGVVWSDRPSPTVQDNKYSQANIDREQVSAFSINNLQNGKTYYARAYYQADNQTYYTREISWQQQHNSQWQRLTSLLFAPEEYVYDSDVITPEGGRWIQLKTINRFTNQATQQLYYTDIDGWNPVFWRNQPQNNLTSAALFNPIYAKFINKAGEQLSLYGAGHQRPSSNQRLYLRTMYILESNGAWEPYPGAEATTTSFGIGAMVYVLENIPNGKLWRFDYGTLQWEALGIFPYANQGRFVGFNTSQKAYVLVEPANEQGTSTLFFEYDVVQNQWKRKADFTGANRRSGLAFTANNRVYYGLGESVNNASGLTDIWEYDPSRNSWQKALEYPGVGRVQVVAANTRLGTLIGFGQHVRPSASGAAIYRSVNDWWLLKF